MSCLAVETLETRPTDSTGWAGVPFRLPEDMAQEVPQQRVSDVAAAPEMDADGGKHDGGPMPPEAPRQPSGGDKGGK